MMRRLELDFAPPTLARTLLLTPGWAWGLGAVGLALLLGSALAWQHARQEQAALQAELAAVDAQWAARQTPVVRKPVAGVPEAQALAVNAVVAQLNRPWAALLDAMEQEDAPSVALLELNPDPKNGRVKGIAEARTLAAMVGFIDRLKGQAVFSRATLTRHEFADQDDSQPVRFEFEAAWPQDPP